jgi:hypothetical protein
VAVNTGALPLGPQYSAGLAADGAVAGQYLIPDFSYTDREQVIVDPNTGVKVKRFTMPRDHNNDLFGQVFTAVEGGVSWITPTAVLANDSSYASYSGTAQDWLYVRTPVTSWSQGLDEIVWPDSLKLGITGYCQGAAACADASERTVEVQQTFDGIAFGAVYEMTLPNGSSGEVISYGASGASAVAGQFWGTGYPTPARDERRYAAGLVYNSGSSTEAKFTLDADCGAVRAGDAIQVRGNNRTVTAVNCSVSPKTMTLNEALNLTPTGGLTGWPLAYAVGWKDNAKFGFRIRKKSVASSAEIRIQYVSFDLWRSGQALATSGGFADRYSDLTTPAGNILSIWENRFYSTNPTTGKTYMIGTNFNSTAGLNSGSRGGGITGNFFWDRSNPRRFWTTARESSGDALVIARCDLAQDDTAPNPWPNGVGVPTTNMTCTNLTPSASNKDLVRLLRDADPHYNSTLYPSVSIYGVAQQYLCLAATRGSQDTYAYMAVFDTGNGGVLGAGGTGGVAGGAYLHEMGTDVAAGVTLRWGVYHTGFNAADSTSCAFQPKHTLNNEGVGNTEFNLVLNQNLTAAAAGTVQTIAVTSTWNGSWGTPPAGFAVGDPLSNCTFPSCTNAVNDTGDYYHGPVQAGDLIVLRSGDNFEVLRVMTRISATQLSVKRGIGIEYDPSFYVPKAWSSGQIGRMQMLSWLANPVYGPGGVAWDFLESPDGQNATAFHYMNYNGGGHQAVKNNYSVAGPEPQAYLYANGLSNSAQVHYTTDQANFNVIRPSEFGGQTSRQVGECTESHPSVPRSEAGRVIWMDSHPMILGGPTCMNTAGTSTPAALVAWPVYKFTALNLHPKHFATFGVSGLQPFRNVSGPGSTISTGPVDWWKMCTVLVAGECFSGSTVGEVYFSAPNLDPDWRFCSSNFGLPFDVCIGDKAYGAGNIVEYNVAADPAQAWKSPTYSAREITTVGLMYRHGNNTHNAHLLPEGKLGLYLGVSKPRPEMLMVVRPEAGAIDSVNRASFVKIPVTVTNVPSGAARLMVKFGYDETFSCSENRAEACYGTGAALDESVPFQWASELTTGSGVDLSGGCSAGCTVSIPSLSGRVVRYQLVYRSAGGTVVFQDAERITTVP